MLKAVKSDKTITIFEGPDGSGKTTVAKQYAQRTGALYIHFDALYGVTNTHKYYMEAMLPALMGYQSVVLDRCWHSGPIYDMVFRNLREHEQRQTVDICTLLDRAAAFCKAVYVRCLPSEDQCIANWKSRLESELVKSENKMRAIYKLYAEQDSVNLPVISYDYTETSVITYETPFDKLVDYINCTRNYEYAASQPRVNIMVSSSVEKSDLDTLIDVPGVRFHPNSNERILATIFDKRFQLGDGPVTESIVNYLSADMSPLELIKYFESTKGNGARRQCVFAIGDEAGDTMHNFVEYLAKLDYELPQPVEVVYSLDVVAEDYFRMAQGNRTLKN